MNRGAFSLSEEDAASGWVQVERTEVEGDKVREVDQPFLVRNPGVKNVPAGTLNPLQFFMLFLTKEILLHIVKETNRLVLYY